MSARNWETRTADTIGCCLFEEKKCAECGKVFLPAPYHAWRRRSKNKNHSAWFCSYHCLVAWDKEHPKKRTVKNGIMY